MSNYAPTRTEYGSSDTRWLPNMLKAETRGVTLDGDLFTTPGVIKSGTFIGLTTTDKLGGPYDNAASDGRQTAVGILLNDVKVAAGGRYHEAIVVRADVKTAYLPDVDEGAADTAGKADLKGITFDA